MGREEAGRGGRGGMCPEAPSLLSSDLLSPSVAGSTRAHRDNNRGKEWERFLLTLRSGPL